MEQTNNLTRAESSRINGAKSRGPLTPEGKAKVRWNALKHGHYAKLAAVVAMENDDFFDKLLAAYLDVIKPSNPIEQRMARELATIDWRMARDVTIQSRLLEQQANDLPDACIEGRETSDIVAQAADALYRRTRSHVAHSVFEARHLTNRKKILESLQAMRKLGPSLNQTPDPLCLCGPEVNEPQPEAA
jgi:hypothetical protein